MPAEAGRVEIAQPPLASASEALPKVSGSFELAGESHMPGPGLKAEAPEVALEPAATETARFDGEAGQAEAAPDVVRIRVLREEEVVESAAADSAPTVEADETAEVVSEAAGKIPGESGDARVVTEELEFELELQPAPRSNYCEMPAGGTARGQ
jgi:hypothetical protein